MLVEPGNTGTEATLRFGQVLQGDAAIPDNFSCHKGPDAASALCDIGAWFLFLPPYSPIQMEIAKLKARLRKAAAPAFEQIWQAVGNVCQLFTDDECYSFFNPTGFRIDQRQHAPAGP
jgi:hypothetical protein